MEAKIESGRVVLSEVPTKDGDNIFVNFEGESAAGRKRLEIRAGMRAYDLPEGVTPEMVTSIEVEPAGMEPAQQTPATVEDEVPAPPGEGSTLEEADKAAVEDGSKVSEDAQQTEPQKEEEGMQ